VALRTQALAQAARHTQKVAGEDLQKVIQPSRSSQTKPEEMRTYDESLKVYWDNYSVIETAKHEGRQQGRQEGREEGREEGLQEGKRNRDIEIAQEMKKAGEPSEKIARFTGLSQEQIQEL
jgi:predicted transposase/invertase (TIGR01784 family)